jgi:hypothetical protein
MGLFGKKKEKVVDWSGGYHASVKRQARASSSRQNDDNSSMGVLGDLANSGTSNSDVSWDNDSPAQSVDYSEKRQKLTRRLLDMTDKIEDLSNQIYHLKQRIELLEKKLKINFE